MIHALRHGARRAMLIASASMIALTFAVPAHAGGSSMPWEAPLQSILESIEGPVAKIVAVIIIIVTGLTLAFGDTRSEKHTSELQSLMRISYAVFCLYYTILLFFIFFFS